MLVLILALGTSLPTINPLRMLTVDYRQDKLRAPHYVGIGVGLAARKIGTGGARQ